MTLDTCETTTPSDLARRRMLSLRGEPMFLADWDRALMLHLEVDSDALQRHVPYPLDLYEGRAFVSLVAFTLRDMRPHFGGPLTAWLFRPIATHEFLNVRTYVRHRDEPGIHFLAEWLTNRLAVKLGPRTFGLPYHLGKITYHHDWENNSLIGRMEDTQTQAAITYRARLEVQRSEHTDTCNLVPTQIEERFPLSPEERTRSLRPEPLNRTGLVLAGPRRVILPLLGGEGRGEGEPSFFRRKPDSLATFLLRFMGRGSMNIQTNKTIRDHPHFTPCPANSLDEWLMERYTAFNCVHRKKKFFRVWHRPWPQARAEVQSLDTSLLSETWPWMKDAEFQFANFSPGLGEVWMGRPHRLKE